MRYLNKVCHYNRDGKSYTGTIIGQKGEEDFLLITVAPFAHNHASYDKCIAYGFVLSIDKDEYIEKRKDECFYFIKRDQIESLLSANDNKIIIKVDENNKLSVVKE